jgi:hypothetical protein
MDESPLISRPTPRIAPPRLHMRTPSRSPTRQRPGDDLLADLSPATTLEAFTNPSGRLKASIDAATPNERTFGLRATLASKKIQEWVDELSEWPWPSEGSSAGFEMPPSKRRKLSVSPSDTPSGFGRKQEPEYIGSLLAPEVARYETRIEEITTEMEDLNVEEIKRQVLDNFSPKSRPSSSASNAPPMPSFLSSYTRMDDFTAIVTATVLQALPNLSRLQRLMDVWSIRLSVLQKVPPLLLALDDAEVALKSGWNTINKPGHGRINDEALSRSTFEIMRRVLQNKVTTLGQDLDYMLDTLEGREDTLPDGWLDRMETIEHDYGEWVVSGDRKVREGEWAKMAKARKEEEDRRRAEEAERARLKAEADEKSRIQAEVEARDREIAEAAERARLKVEQDARDAEAARIQAQKDAEEAKAAEIARKKAESEARERELAEAAETARRKAQQEAEDAEAARLQAQNDAEEAERARVEALRKIEAIEAARIQALKEAEEAEAAAIAKQKAKRDAEEAQAAELARQKALEDAEAARIAEAARRQAEDDAQKAELARQAEHSSELARQKALKDAQDAEIAETARRKAEEAAEFARRRTLQELDGAATAGTVKLQAVKDSEDDDCPFCEAESARRSISPTRLEFDGASRNEPFEAFRLSSTPTKAQHFPTTEDQLVRKERSVDSPRTQILNSPSPTLRETPSFSDVTSPSSASNISNTLESLTTEPDEVKTAAIAKIALPELVFADPYHQSPLDREEGPAFDAEELTTSHEHIELLTPTAQTPTRDVFKSDGAVESIESDKSISTENDEWVVINSQDEDEFGGHNRLRDFKSSDFENTDVSPSKRHSRNLSVISGYSESDPTPEIHKAEAAEYFRPTLSPVKSVRSLAEKSAPTTPSKSPLRASKVKIPDDVLSAAVDPETTGPQAVSENQWEFESQQGVRLPDSSENNGSSAIESADGAQESILRTTEEHIDLPLRTHQTSMTHGDNLIKEISISRQESISSEIPTIMNGRAIDGPSSPMTSPGCPCGLEAFPEDGEQSPTLGRIGLRHQKSYDYSPPDSPPPIPAMSNRRSLQLLQSPEFSASDLTAPSTPTDDAPLFDNLDISDAPLLSSPKKNTTDDQIQQQISSLLESIPARIRLTSESDSTPFTSNTLRLKKTRRSITPSMRSSSSMSNYSTNSRAPTPSFTLAPAFGRTSRQRPASGNPEIKVYHLSRSTGEAPIKLFVRLVGEHGERVMVRVGGGWADLGEYLKEYASHHGRRTTAESEDKVEIQDLPSRNVSNGSTISSSSTIRGNGRSSPAPRPASVLERERPMSSLNISKTRRSIGTTEPNPLTRTNMMSEMRSPSTPLPSLNRRSLGESPLSEASARSSSRLSWTEEDSSLGLAGPRAKKKSISEKDQEWVESMKEKVRLASAEKEKKEKERERKTSFGEMEKVGGTKRLFRRG